MGVAAVIVLVAATSARAAEPCLEPFRDVPPLLLPVDGASDVPTNATPITIAGAKLAIDGADVAAHIDTFTMAGDATIAFQRIVPDASLPAGASVDVVVDGARLGGFTIGAAQEEAAPVISGVQLLHEQLDDCKSYVVLTGVPAGVDDLLLIAKLNSTPTLEPGEVFDGVARASELFVEGPPDTPARVRVAGVNLAGNISEAVSVDVIFPERPEGCAQTSPTVFAALLLALSARAPRRRR